MPRAVVSRVCSAILVGLLVKKAAVLFSEKDATKQPDVDRMLVHICTRVKTIIAKEKGVGVVD